MAKTGATAGVSVAVGISFMSFDPTSFFDFMNTAEMFYSVYLFNLEVSPVLGEFLMGLRIMRFYRFIDINQGHKLNSKYKKFGYTSSLFLLNTSVHLQTFLIALFLAFLTFLITRLTYLNSKLKFLINIFKYNFFLRFWLQTFFELTTALGVSMRNSRSSNKTEKIDFIICCIILVKSI